MKHTNQEAYFIFSLSLTQIYNSTDWWEKNYDTNTDPKHTHKASQFFSLTDSDQSIWSTEAISNWSYFRMNNKYMVTFLFGNLRKNNHQPSTNFGNKKGVSNNRQHKW